MNDSMTETLASLPSQLRMAAKPLWERCGEVTDEVTPTLQSSFRILGQVCCDPEALTRAGDLLALDVTASIEEALGYIEDTYPAVTDSWQGSGAASFQDYIPRLSLALKSVLDSAQHTSDALDVFSYGVADIYSAIVSRTQRTEEDAAATIAANRQAPYEAIGPVIDIVEEYSAYVEELASSLMDLTSDTHAAGRELTKAAEAPADLESAGGRLRLPRLDVDFSSGDFQPVHAQVSMDTAAMAELTSRLSDNGVAWEQASQSSSHAAQQLTPEAFGLAGAHFCDDLHSVLDRDRQLYATVNGHLDELATGLRLAAVEFATGDDAITTELRRCFDDRRPGN